MIKYIFFAVLFGLISCSTGAEYHDYRQNEEEYSYPDTDYGGSAGRGSRHEPRHYNYAAAKRILRDFYYREHSGRYRSYNRTIYCSCPIMYRNGKMNGADLKACGFRSLKKSERTYRIEWEHIVPASHMGKQRKCWQNGGRKNCTANDPYFSIMEGDMHNLQPSIGEVNEARAHYRYADAGLTPYQFGECDIVVDHKQKIMQPPEAARGIIARTYLYMYSRYKMKMSDRDAKMYQVWDRRYPPSEWECYRNRRIMEIQGNDNPFITRSCHDVSTPIPLRKK